MVAHLHAQGAPDSGSTGLLDAVALEGAWVLPVRMALQELSSALTPEDAVILAHLRGQAQSTPFGSAMAGEADTLEIPEGAAKRLPVTLALLAWRRGGRGPAVTSLTAVLANAALGPEGRDPAQRTRIKELARYVRVAIEDPRSPLRALLAGAGGVTSLLQHLDGQLAAGNQSHLTFNRLWRGWLRHRIARWIHADPGRLSQALGAGLHLVIATEAPSVPVAGGAVDDGDDQLELSSSEVDGAVFDGLGPRSIYALATAQQLLRRSGDPGLSLDPDQIVPDGLIQAGSRLTLQAGQAAIAAGDRARAEPFLALGFAISTGLREVDLSEVAWGEVDGSGDTVVDIDAPVMWLRLKRPPQAAVPPQDLIPFLKPCADVVHWPLPPALHRSLKALRGDLPPTGGTPVFPLGRTLGGVYRLRDVVARLLPGAQFGAGRFRQVLATHLSARFGPEVAQLVMRDTFSTSLGPAYYGWVPESEVMSEVSGLLTSWFGERVAHLGGRIAGVGSRIALQDDIARQWPTRLAQEAYSAARRKGGWLLHLVALRNHLAGALCAITGVRPGNCVGDLMLDSVVPEYGLVILEDKQVDVLRRTRVAATGRRWIAALNEYLHRLAELSRQEDPAVAGWAMGVLRNEQPLFSVPAECGGVQRLEMGTLQATMPPVLAQVSNHYRHRLNQLLQQKNVDWELRHAQLGWVVSPCFALADLSPLSARSLGEQLGPLIDELVVDEGWYTRRQRTPRWSWVGLPDRPMKDWEAEVRSFEREHAIHVRGVREAFVARRKEVEERVLPRLAGAVAQLIPALEVDTARKTLALSPGFKSDGPVPLVMDHYALLRDRVRKDDDDPTSALEGLAAEFLIHQLVTKAVKEKVVSGPEPPRRHLGVTAHLSPFLPGIGLAVRHAEAIRIMLSKVAAENRAHDKPGIAHFAVLAGTPYRDLDAAAAATGAAANSVRASTRREWLHVPARQDRKEVPMVLAGTDAAILARRGKEAPTAKPLAKDELAKWARKRLGGVSEFAEEPCAWLDKVLGALRAAGRIELSGPERLVMSGHPLATVDTRRILAVVDEWPLQTAAMDEEEARPPEQLKGPPSGNPGPAQRVNRSGYRRFASALNPDVSRRRQRGASDGKRAWRGAVGHELDGLLGEVGHASNLGLIIQYFRHRLMYGGRRKRHLSQRNLHKELTRFGSVLLDVLGRRPLAELGANELQESYLAVLCAKKASTQPEVLEELQKFHRYLETVHHAVDVDFSPLRAFSGPRVRTADAGALSNAEIGRVFVELSDDFEREQARVDAGPEDVRACALRILLYLVLESSGVRPDSAHGLVLGDFHLLAPGADFIHIHRTGDYGAAKTTTSVGFVRLEGDLWATHRDWTLAWLEKERSLAGDGWWKLPAFAESAGSRRRFARRYLTTRMDVLLKWASNQPRARTYWIRKRRVTIRLGAAMTRQASVVREVYRALRESGHADILTPLMHYIYDAAVPLSHYLNRAGRPDRSRVLAMTGVPAPQLDAVWHRQRRRGNDDFHGAVLDHLGTKIATKPIERITDPPALFRQRILTPRHIDLYAREYRRRGERQEAMARSGLSTVQVELLESRIEGLVVRNGFAPWEVRGIRQRRGILAPARKMEGTAELFALLDEAPSQALRLLAGAWESQGYIHRLHGDHVVLLLDSEVLRVAAESLLLRARLDLEIEPLRRGRCALSARKNEQGRRSTHAVGVRWVLAMIWLYQQLISEPDAS